MDTESTLGSQNTRFILMPVTLESTNRGTSEWRTQGRFLLGGQGGIFSVRTMLSHGIRQPSRRLHDMMGPIFVCLSFSRDNLTLNSFSKCHNFLESESQEALTQGGHLSEALTKHWRKQSGKRGINKF